VIFSTLLLGFMPTVFFQEPEETELEAAQRKVAELEAELGPEHPDVAFALNNLADLLRREGSYAEAHLLFEQSLAIWEKSFGSEHPDVARALNNFAGLLKDQGSYAEARPLYEQGLRGTLNHLSLNMGSMTETERFQYLEIQTGPEPLLLNLVAMRGEGPKED
jgi:tetratricopeptide (TPR) repeat protein